MFAFADSALEKNILIITFIILNFLRISMSIFADTDLQKLKIEILSKKTYAGRELQNSKIEIWRKIKTRFETVTQQNAGM